MRLRQSFSFRVWPAKAGGEAARLATAEGQYSVLPLALRARSAGKVPARIRWRAYPNKPLPDGVTTRHVEQKSARKSGWSCQSQRWPLRIAFATIRRYPAALRPTRIRAIARTIQAAAFPWDSCVSLCRVECHRGRRDQSLRRRSRCQYRESSRARTWWATSTL